MSGDERAVAAAIAAAAAAGRRIPDGVARTLASWAYSGQASDGYRFVSTGAISDPAELSAELARGGLTCSEAAAMADYLAAAGPRGGVPRWHALWCR